MPKAKERKKIRELPNLTDENPPSMEDLGEMLSDGLVQIVSRSSFQFFRDRKFRRAIGFDKLEQVEQDRIFNELVVTGLILVMMTLEAPDLRVDPDFKEYLHDDLKSRIPNAYLEQLKEFGINREYRKIWKKLINLRYKEYQERKADVRSAAMDFESEGGELDNEAMSRIQIALPIHTMAIGAHLHITRGKGKPEHPAFKLILNWVSRLYAQVRIMVEGGKITFWNRLVAKALSFLDSLRI